MHLQQRLPKMGILTFTNFVEYHNAWISHDIEVEGAAKASNDIVVGAVIAVRCEQVCMREGNEGFSWKEGSSISCL